MLKSKQPVHVQKRGALMGAIAGCRPEEVREREGDYHPVFNSLSIQISTFLSILFAPVMPMIGMILFQVEQEETQIWYQFEIYM